MKLFLTILTALGIFMYYIGFMEGRKHSKTITQVIRERIYIPPTIDTLYDTISVKSSPRLTWTEEDVILLVKYCKTQQSDIDPDFWGVVQTMINRCNVKKVNMRQYFARNNINNSETIQRIKKGKRNPNFNFNYNSEQDLTRRAIVYAALLDLVPDSLYLPKNVLYFESHPLKWNKHRTRGPFNRKNIFKSYEDGHEFYIDPNFKDGKKESPKASIALHTR